MSSNTRLMGLLDGAAHDAVYPILEESGASFRPLYAGLPEAVLGRAGLFLVEIDDPEAEWVTRIDQLDLQLPCLSLVWSRVAIDDLAGHLREFLFADLADGTTALIRYFDPRNTGAVFQVWRGAVMDAFMGPIDRWLYRGRNKDWQRVVNDTLSGAHISKSIVIQLDQTELDFLTSHTEPDQLLASLIQLELVDGDRPYFARFSDFWPRYERALEWALRGSSDRLGFCRHTYRYGFDFDRHPFIHDALSTRMRTGETYDAVIGRVPAHVWKELTRKRDTRQQLKDQEERAANAEASR